MASRLAEERRRLDLTQAEFSEYSYPEALAQVEALTPVELQAVLATTADSPV